MWITICDTTTKYATQFVKFRCTVLNTMKHRLKLAGDDKTAIDFPWTVYHFLGSDFFRRFVNVVVVVIVLCLTFTTYQTVCKCPIQRKCITLTIIDESLRINLFYFQYGAPLEMDDFEKIGHPFVQCTSITFAHKNTHFQSIASIIRSQVSSFRSTREFCIVRPKEKRERERFQKGEKMHRI